MSEGEHTHAARGAVIGLLAVCVISLFYASMACTGGSCTTGDVVRAVATADIDVGDTVRVDVNAESLADVVGYDIDVQYDPSILSLDSVEKGNFLSQGSTGSELLDTMELTSGSITDIVEVRMGGTGVTGDGVLFSLHFTGVGAGTTDVLITDVQLADSSAQSTSDDAVSTTVTVTDPQSDDGGDDKEPGWKRNRDGDDEDLPPGLRKKTEDVNALISYGTTSDVAVISAMLEAEEGTQPRVVVTDDTMAADDLGLPEGFNLYRMIRITSETSGAARITIELPLADTDRVDDLVVYSLSQGSWQNVAIDARRTDGSSIQLDLDSTGLGVFAIGTQDGEPLRPIEPQQSTSVVRDQVRSAQQWQALGWALSALGIVIIGGAFGIILFSRKKGSLGDVPEHQLSIAERYVHDMRTHGLSDERIAEELKKQGWPDRLITDLL